LGATLATANVKNESPLNKICGLASAEIDIVFVHGLTGDPRATWSCLLDDSFWPQWIHDDLNRVALYTFGYPASLFAKWAKKEMDIFERAANTLEVMAGMSLGQRPIVFVAHSLGGLLVKILLRKANESTDSDFKKIAASTRLVVFLSTPHTGSSLAGVINALPGKSSHIALLANDTGFLEDLKLSYKKLTEERDDLSTVAYYEKKKTKNVALVVDRYSADPGACRCEPVALDKDHIDICKPANRDDVLYLGIRRHISKLLAEVPLRHSIDDDESYANPSETDRRSLFDKFVDANRESEYYVANDGQNKFAQKLTKIGLFSSTRSDYDLLMNTVKQRFILHVFGPLICKGAEYSAVSDAIQTKVIDPVTCEQIGNSMFRPEDVLNALYFLTEQCHISWSPPHE
jgi:hypothetical protein